MPNQIYMTKIELYILSLNVLDSGCTFLCLNIYLYQTVLKNRNMKNEKYLKKCWIVESEISNIQDLKKK